MVRFQQTVLLFSCVALLIAVWWQCIQTQLSTWRGEAAEGVYSVRVQKENGSFHLRIAEGSHCNRTTIFVEGFTRLAGSGGAASAERPGVISTGDVFAAIDGHVVLGAPFREVVRFLRAAGDAPIELTFVRPTEAKCSLLASRFVCPYSICTVPPAVESYPSTLVVLLGNARGGKVAWDSLEKHVLSPLRADLALAFGSTSIWPSQLTSLAKYKWTFEEPSNWTSVLDSAAREEGDSTKTKRWRRHARRCRGKGLYGPATVDGEEEAGSGVIIFAFRDWLLRSANESGVQLSPSSPSCLETLEKYDRVILTRADHVYVCDHPDVDVESVHNASIASPIQEAPPVVWIPAGEDYDGITDRHHIFNGKRDARSMLNVLRWLVRQKSKLEQHSCRNPEECLMEYFRFVGVEPRIRRFSRTMFTAKVTGVDTTRWTEGAKYWDEVAGHPGLIAKYPDEYSTAKAECALASELATGK